MSGLQIILFVLLVQNPALPKPPVGTASVEGVVVKLGTNEPISGADLELTIQTAPGAPAIPPYTAKSAPDGKFAFRNIGAGTYKLVAARIGGGFSPVEFGQRGVLGRGVAFPVTATEQKKDIRLEMAPVGSITGRVLDSDNRPVGHVAVMAFVPIYRRGERILTMMALVHSDDRGEFRLFSLVPGRYYVAARLEDLTRRTVPLGFYPPGRILASDRIESPVVNKRVLPTGEVAEETYQIVYYGGGTNLDLATPVDVGSAANVAGVDISIAQGKAPSLHIRGKVTTSNSAISSSARVVASPQRYAPDLLVPSGVTDANGVFDLAGAVPGKYFLNVLVPPDPNVRTTPPPLPQIGMMSIEVGTTDLEGVAISATPGTAITGKITMENRPETDPDLAKIRIDLTRDPDIQGPPFDPNAKFSPNGEFSLATVPDGAFIAQVNGLPAYAYTKSMRIGNTDLLEYPLRVAGKVEGRLEVVIGTDASTLTGQVTDERQDPAINVKVALVPDAPLRRRWDLYKSATTDQSGQFTMRGVPPGDYKVFAWEEAEDNAWQDPEFLRTDEARGRPIHIGSASGEKVEAIVISVKRR